MATPDPLGWKGEGVRDATVIEQGLAALMAQVLIAEDGLEGDS